MRDKQEAPAKKAPEGARTPKGPLPKKTKMPTTTGKRGVGLQEERYCPSKRLKTAHRKYEGGGTLRDFVSKFGDRKIVADWLMNKKSSGR